MSRYIAKVVKVLDPYTIAINAGSDKGFSVGQRFTLVSLGEMLTDPDTGERLEQLEIVRGKVEVTHVQNKISTLKSCDYTKEAEKKEITRVKSTGTGLLSLTLPQETVTENITPAQPRLRQLHDVQIGDLLVNS